MKISVIIPFYNRMDYLSKCLHSIIESNCIVQSIYIVNNSTIDLDFGNILKLSSIVKVIDTKPAIGFGRACNIGLQHAINEGMDVGILMNQDAVFEKDAIKLLSRPALAPDSFGTVPISYSYNFSAIHPKVFSGYLQPVKGYIKDKNLGVLKEKYQLSYLQANGSCVALNLKVIKSLPWFDPVFKMYGEDVEFFRRMIETERLSLYLIPKAQIGHIHSQISNIKGKNKNNAFGRFGGQVMLLKWREYLKFFIKTFHTYLLAIKRFNFKLVWLYFISDLQLVSKFRTILKSRNKQFLSRQIKKYLQNDRIT